MTAEDAARLREALESAGGGLNQLGSVLNLTPEQEKAWAVHNDAVQKALDFAKDLLSSIG